MRRRDEPTPHLLDDDRDSSGPDLPLSSIPSVPGGESSDPERRSAWSHILVGAALFALILSISVLGARYLKLPRSPLAIGQPQEHPAPLAEAAAAPETAPAEPAAAPPTQAPVLDQAPPPAALPAAAAPGADEGATLEALRRDLETRTHALSEARRDLEHEQKLRKAAERRADEAKAAAAAAAREPQDARAPARGARNAKGAPAAEPLDKKSRARLQALEKEVAVLRKENADAKQDAHNAAVQAASRESAAAETQTRIAAAEKRATAAEAQVRDIRQSHEQALKGESDAVRRLMADLNAARDDAAAEKTARAEAEQKTVELEAELKRARAGGTAARTAPVPAPAARPATRAPATAPPATHAASQPESTGAPHAEGEVREPERLRTTPPYYPDDLRRAHVGGRVLLRLLVDESGHVEDVQVTRTPDRRLGDLAAAAARKWTYTPGRRDGIRAKMWITEAVDFKV